MQNELEWLKLQAEVLFLHDKRGRLTRINEFQGQRAPRFFWGRTVRGNILRFRDDVPDTVVNRITQIINDCDDNDLVLEQITDTLERHGKISGIWRGPAYLFDEHSIRRNQALAVKVTEDNKGNLASGFKNILADLKYREPCYMIMEDHKAVSICFSARSTMKAAEAGIETLEAYRGKDYAIAVASAWSEAVNESGKAALYSTSWDNHASQAVAKRLQLSLYGTDVSIY